MTFPVRLDNRDDENQCLIQLKGELRKSTINEKKKYQPAMIEIGLAERIPCSPLKDNFTIVSNNSSNNTLKKTNDEIITKLESSNISLKKRNESLRRELKRIKWVNPSQSSKIIALEYGLRRGSSPTDDDFNEEKKSEASSTDSKTDDDGRLKAIVALKNVALKQEQCILTNQLKYQKLTQDVQQRDEKIAAMEWATKELRMKGVQKQRQLDEKSKQNEQYLTELKEKERLIVSLKKEKDEALSKCEKLLKELYESYAKLEQFQIVSSTMLDNDSTIADISMSDSFAEETDDEVQQHLTHKIQKILALELEFGQIKNNVNDMNSKLDSSDTDKLDEEARSAELSLLSHVVSTKKEKLKNELASLDDDLFQASESSFDALQETTDVQVLNEECLSLRSHTQIMENELKNLQKENNTLLNRVEKLEKNENDQMTDLKAIKDKLETYKSRVAYLEESSSEDVYANATQDAQPNLPSASFETNPDNRMLRSMSGNSFDSIAMLNTLSTFSYDEEDYDIQPPSRRTRMLQINSSIEEELPTCIDNELSNSQSYDENVYQDASPNPRDFVTRRVIVCDKIPREISRDIISVNDPNASFDSFTRSIVMDCCNSSVSTISAANTTEQHQRLKGGLKIKHLFRGRNHKIAEC